ncbi:MAG: formate dehydrogenase subunit delta [Sphingobium sp.]|jgi:formate dehydrogenase subunit delta|nr:formate dehydrogenase subunit delta [Sphingobium sp.]MCI1272479.1 formate dehydrogenase subunit delta [Sphingobium sp.]MCI1755378.1 formate dehydrogenase subunit delta [Sphingobium sp.]MCI2054403.1 formate dehydrogenase subunit delta [Sphingobium sp.]
MDQGHLVHMANQIARNLAAQGEDAAVTMMAQHLKDFWDPRMKSAILSVDPVKLDTIAAKAIAQLGAHP